MHWFLKAMGFQILGRAPAGPALYRWAQENISRSLEPTEERLSQKLRIGRWYHDALQKVGWLSRLPQATLMDLGAGWQPTLPLLFYSLGCSRQILADIAPVMTAGLAEKTARTFQILARQPAWRDLLDAERVKALDQVRWYPWPPRDSPLGWDYVAPCQDWLSRQRGSLDLVVTTGVLLHPSQPELDNLMAQIHRALRPGGLLMGMVPLTDVFATSDPRITPYNFLRFSPWFWRQVVSSPMMSYNRLRPSQYRESLQKNGLAPVVWELGGLTEENRQKFRRIRPHACFRAFPEDELVATDLFFVAERQDSIPPAT